MQTINDKLIELLAFETLNYHNKNVLSGDDESRSRYMQRELRWLIDRVEEAIKDQQAKTNNPIEMQIKNIPCEELHFYRKSRQG